MLPHHFNLCVKEALLGKPGIRMDLFLGLSFRFCNNDDDDVYLFILMIGLCIHERMFCNPSKSHL